MHRLAKIDITSIGRTRAQRLGVEIGFGALCAGAMIALRSAIDVFAPTSGPFALVYPTILIATLFGHWRAGVVAHVISFLWAWWFVLERSGSFEFVVPTDPSRVLINAICTAVLIVFAEAFRRAVRNAAEARDAEIVRRDVLMRELEHRTKNNFALVASLLEIQKRRLSEPEAIAALDEAVNRVHTFARAYETLSRTQEEGFPVPMNRYLEGVAARVARGAFEGNVSVRVRASETQLPRQVAVAVGLFVNEAITNCAKYAFPDGREGTVDVIFEGDAGKWNLTVEDDGVGMTPCATSKPGLGTGLLSAFADQAGARYVVEKRDNGLRVCLRCGSEA